MSRVPVLAALCAALVLVPSASAKPPAPGAPGDRHTWAPADKHGFLTAHQRGGNAYATLRQASLSEVYFPDLSTPAYRGLQFAVRDGRTLQRETATGDAAHAEPVARGVQARVDAAAGRARLPPGRLRAGLAADQDVDHRPGPAGRAGGRAARLALRPQAPALRARRPGAGRRRRRRPRVRAPRAAARVGRRRGGRRGRDAAAAARDERLRRHAQRPVAAAAARRRPEGLGRAQARQRGPGRADAARRRPAPVDDARDRVRRAAGGRGAPRLRRAAHGLLPRAGALHGRLARLPRRRCRRRPRRSPATRR